MSHGRSVAAALARLGACAAASRPASPAELAFPPAAVDFRTVRP